MEEPKRIPPEEVYQKLKVGKALLVCAYKDLNLGLMKIRLVSGSG